MWVTVHITCSRWTRGHALIDDILRRRAACILFLVALLVTMSSQICDLPPGVEGRTSGDFKVYRKPNPSEQLYRHRSLRFHRGCESKAEKPGRAVGQPVSKLNIVHFEGRWRGADLSLARVSCVPDQTLFGRIVTSVQYS